MTRRLRQLIDWHRQCYPRIGQIQLVHDLVVIVARRRLGIAGEGVRIRPLEEDHAALLLVEIRMLLRIVEAVLVMSDDLASVHPRAKRRVGLGVPDLPEK